MCRLLPFVALLASLTLPALPVLGQAPADLEAYLAAPQRSGLVAAPDHDRIAWVENRSGVRNLWMAEAPAFTPVPLTAYDADDGQTLSDLAFTADGQTLVFTYGDGRNRTGEYPNPTSAAATPEQQIRAVDLADPDSVRTLAAGSDALPAPAGSDLVFVRDGNTWRVPADGSAEAEELFAVRGRVRDLAWSPDGQALAFVSDRGDHALLGIYRRGADRIDWIAPSVDRDADPVWSPDGTQFAFYRFEGPRMDVAYTGFGPESEPYAVWVASADGAEAREVWRSPRDGRQGYPSVQGSRPLTWVDGQTLLVPAEVTGWLHLYALDIASGALRDRTPGDCMVEDAAVQGGTLYATHNCADLDSRVLSRIDVATGEQERISAGPPVVTWAPTPLPGGGVAYIEARSDRPGTVVVRPSADAAPQLLNAEANPPASLFQTPETVVFTTDDGERIHGQLFTPPAGTAGPHPAVLFLHGGSRRQMFPAFHMSGYYHNAYAFNQYLADQGYVVLSVNYRSGIGYGKDFRQPPGYGWQGASEYNDVLAARRFLAGRADVDADRIGLWGGSYGGYLTALGLARDSDLFAAGVDLHGVHDWTTTLRFWGSDLFDLDAPEAAVRADSLQRLAFASSPNAALDTWTSPVLLIHGDDDRNVDIAETLLLADLLREKGDVTVETLVLPDEVHGFLRYDSWRRTYEAAARFLDAHLR